MKTSVLARFVVASVIAAGAFAACAQSLDKPVLLVASPQAAGFYRHAVMVVVPGGEGHVGFIINRATRTTVASAFPEEPASARVVEPIYLGGPTSAQSLYAVVRSDPGEGSRKLFGDAFLAAGADTLDRIIRQSPREARYFAGFAVWDAGELAREIGQGAWLTADPDAALLFHPNPEAMWSGLVGQFAVVTR